jgi:HEPN domain-containing protein
MKDSRREAERWRCQAENDLEFGRVALREGFFHQACFIAQQAAEKAVKAILYQLGERVVLGHSLVELTTRLAERLPATTGLRDAAGILDQYYIATRYPNGLPGGVPFQAFGEAQAREALEHASRFLALARDLSESGGSVSSHPDRAGMDQLPPDRTSNDENPATNSG